MHAVTGETLDGSVIDRCADDVFVHQPTVSNELAAPRLAGIRLPEPASLADMRIAVLIAASVLVGGCSQGVGGDAEQTRSPPRRPPTRTTTSTPRTTTPTSTHRRPNRRKPGAEIADVITFIEAGQPADAGQFHTATRDGTTTQLGDDVAFTTPVRERRTA